MRRISTANRPAVRHAHPAAGTPLTKALAATAELCGAPLSVAAVALLAEDLSRLPPAAVEEALARCRMELRGPLNIGEILARLDDGRPAMEDAWNMLPASEEDSVVWTREMAFAWGQAQPLLQAGELAAARRLFGELYVQAVLIARCRQEHVRWLPSLGTDAARREAVLLEALKHERLPAFYVKKLLPYRSLTKEAGALLARVHIKNFP